MPPTPAIPEKRSNVGRTPQLSCELCRERKVKCDKRDPCTNCKNAGVVCVPMYRMRLPRGRHASQAKQQRIINPTRPSLHEKPWSHASATNRDISRRICRLERMVTDLRSDESASLDPLLNEIRELDRMVDVAQGGTTGLSESTQTVLASSVMAPLRFSNMREANALSMENCTGFSRTAMTKELCQIYLQQVDPVLKILHRPSLANWIMLGNGYLHYPEDHPSLNALGLAVCYTAAVSLTEAQSLSLFQMDKGSLIEQYRSQCEVTIEKAGLLTTDDITVLQAFVLYLIGRRTEDPTQAVWTLIAVAVRVAKSLSLDVVNESHKQTFFDQQMRKRLWLTICLMDLQASFSEGSMPLISPDEVASSLPLLRNINDTDFNWSTIDDVPHKEGLTDTTFSLVTYYAQLGGRIAKPIHDEKKCTTIIEDSTPGSSFRPQPSWTSWTPDSATRQQRAKDFEERALNLLHFCDPESSSYAWFTWHGTQCLISATRLLAMHPILRPDNNSRNQNTASNEQSGLPPPWPSTPELQQLKHDVLRLALNVLDKARMIQTDPRSEGFQWYITVPWHAFAVALVECYTCTDTSLLKRAYPLLESTYSYCVKLALQEKSKNSLRKLLMRTRVRIEIVLREDAANNNNNNTTSSWTTTTMTDQIAPTTTTGMTTMTNYDGHPSCFPANPVPSVASFPTTHQIRTPLPSSTSLGVDNLGAHPSPSWGTSTLGMTPSSPGFESTSQLPCLEWDNNPLFATGGVEQCVDMDKNDSGCTPDALPSGYPDILDLLDEVFSDLPFGTLPHPDMI